MKSNKFLALALILTAVFLKDGQCAVRFGRKKPVLGSLDTELPINPAVSVHKTPGNDGISMEKAIQAVQRDCEEFRLDCDFGNASEFLNANAGKLPKTLDAIVKDVFNHLGINSTKLMKKNKRKKRRAMVNREENLWGLGQIPYIWDASSPYTSPGDPRYDNHIRQLIEGNMAKISSQTCITFHRWYNGIEEKHEGMKPGRLLIGSYRGCWSQVGYHGNQFISPCKSGAAMQHELAHAIGLSHEHRSPDSNKYIKSYPKNWGSGLRNDWSTLYLFTMTDYYSNFNITFDLSSGMIGSIPRRGATNRIVYDTLDKNARYLNSGSDLGLNFRDYKSINLGYKCFERFCKGQTLTCENEGYPAYAGGKCKCSCPRGLAGDRCEQVTTVPESTEWPSGNYGLPMPVDTGCPAGTWATGQRVHLNDQGSTTFSSGTPELRPQWRSENASNVYFDFCIKKGTEETQKLPRGTYCVYKVGDSCPSGPWEDGSLQYLGGSGVSKSGTLPSGSFTDTETMLEYCCRFDRQGTYAEPMIFPHTKPFYLFSPTSSCQEVHGMIHKRQSVWMKISNFTIVEPIPHHSVSSESVYMYLCYYYPKTDGHGEVFELTPEKPEKIITSHGYPIKYQRGLQQYWFAKVPEGGLVQLDLQVFDVYYNTEDGQCIDYMETTVYGIDQNGKRFCANGHHVNKTITSKTNLMMIKFLSQSINGSTGFKIKVKGIFPNQLCYKLSDGGTSYRGTLNYTQNYKPCLAWDKVRHCPYNTFDIRSVGSGIAGNNYCRNPSMITQPWCYIDADECIQDMCDACVLDRCHDVYDDCAENMALDSAYCNADPNAFTGCHFSCGFCKTPDPVISCSNPPISESAIFIGPIKTVYAVGDVVEYECKKSGIKGGMRRTCLGDGTWSYASSQCSGCKTGYEEFDGRCYKLYPEFLNFQEASTKCQTDDPLYYPAAICNLKKKVFIDEFIERHGDPTRWLHTGIIVEDEGKLKCTDGTDYILMADWVPWYSDTVPILLAGNVIINIKNAWQPQSMTYKASVVCEGKTPGEMKCSDRQSDCQQQLKMNPDVCLNAIDFKQTQCRWSCGVCKDTQNPGKPCTAPPTFGNATLNGMKTSLYLGETAQYTCNGGYAKQEGDLKRVCLADGSLGGTDPQCVGDDEMAYKIGKDHIYLQDKEDTSGSMNIDASMKVPRTSKPVAYIFYSKYAGQLAFQVWRKIGTYTFKLIGENTVTTKEDRQMYVKIAPEKQIRMQKGDYIGWKNLNRRNAPLTYVNCVKKFMPNYKDTFYQIPDAYRKSFPESANFNLMVGECRNYSLQIIAHPFSGAGFLSNIQAVCDVPSVPNAKASHPQIGVPEGTEVSITCLPSYTATTGATKITCLKSGLWSAAHVQCYEPKNTTDSTACVFPFIVNGASHLDCVGFPPWCATTANHDEDQKAGLCQLECKSPTGNKQPGQSWTFQDKRYFCDEGATIQLIPAPEKTVDGYDCVFPWKYHNAYYGTCYLSNQENRLWCSLTADYDKDKKYNYCGVTCTAQNGTRVHAGDSWKHEGLSYFCNEESKIILIPEPEVKAAVEGKVCGFPYFFKEKWWGTCNMIGADKPWCSLNSGDYSVKKEWAYCKTACYNQNGTRVYAGDSWEHEDLRYFCNEESKIMPIPEPEVKTAVEGKVCGFPYFYNDKWWGTCNMFSADKPWCSLNSGNYYDTREWSYCKMGK